jgi:predicted ester cyclase
MSWITTRQGPGFEGLKEWLASARASFPDLHGTVEDAIVEGDRLAARVTWRATHRGEFAGVAPTNKQVEMAAYHHVRFADGRAAEWWGTADVFGVLQQLGATVAAPKT